MFPPSTNGKEGAFVNLMISYICIYIQYKHTYIQICVHLIVLGFCGKFIHLESPDGSRHLDYIYLAYVRNILNTEPATY